MAWDFETEPEFQKELDWIERFVREEVEPLDYVLGNPYDVRDPARNALVRPLQAEVKRRKLWACHLGADLGGQGYGQVKLALMNEILGRSRFAPIVFGCQAPDSGNAEILAHYGTEEQKKRFLKPLLDNEIVSCFSMTEPQGGADPKVFQTTAKLVGDQWVLNGEKWFSSNAHVSSFLIVMAITDPEASPYERMSMFIVPKETPGFSIVRNMAVGLHEGEGSHAYVRYDDVRVPRDAMLGPRGGAFVVAQTRLGGGRIHHAMRTIGQVRKAFDMMCERVLSRVTQGEVLAKKQMVQEKVADAYIALESFRLLVLHAAWKIDQVGGHKARTEIAMVKVLTPQVLMDVVYPALHIHGSLGTSNEMPLQGMWNMIPVMGIADGPTEVHKVTIARQVLKRYQPSEGLFPSMHLPPRREAARKRFADLLEHEVVEHG